MLDLCSSLTNNTPSAALPDSVQQVVLLSGLSEQGAISAASLALSPFLRATPSVLMVDDVSPSAPSSPDLVTGAALQQANEAGATLRAAKKAVVLSRQEKGATPPQYFMGSERASTPQEALEMLQRVRLHPVEGPAYVVNPASDVVLCILDSVMENIDNAVHKLTKVLDTMGPNGQLVVIADKKAQDALKSKLPTLEDANRSSGPVVVALHVPELGPPSLEYGLTSIAIQSKKGLQSMLPSVCAGAVLGLINELPVLRFDKVPVVPIDVAINAAMMTLVAAQSMRSPNSNASNARAFVVTMSPSNSDSLVWGMVGEYILDYYGRYIKQITDVLPDGVVCSAPTVEFKYNPEDAINWGPDSAGMPTLLMQQKRRQCRKSLSGRLPNSAAFADMLRSVDAVNTRVESLSIPASTGFSAALRFSLLLGISGAPKQEANGSEEVYNALVNHLLSHKHTRALVQYVSMKNMDWGMYVRFVQKCVLEHIAVRLVHKEPSQVTFPMPTRAYVNEISYSPHCQAPPFPSSLRQAFPTVEWLVRVGMGPSGSRQVMDPGMTPQAMDAILAEPRILAVIDKISQMDKQSKDDVVKRSRRILQRIGDRLNAVHSRILGTMVHNLFQRVYHQVYMNPNAHELLLRLDTAPRVEIVYVPLHRSYSDFMIMSFLLLLMGRRPPHIVAGEDFLRMGKFAELMRGSGAFFMRRTFRGDPLYGSLFREYVRQLVMRCLPLEFFIEGTRSRTGKTMVPKLGILKFITDAFFDPACKVDDVLFVPVSLSYDELLEARMYADELLGIPKPKESVPNMLKAATQLKHKYGNINMHFGEPISLSRFKEHPSQCPIPFQPRRVGTEAPVAPSSGSATTSSSSTPPSLLTALGWRITYELQKNILVTPSALVSAVVECFYLPSLAADSSSTLSLDALVDHVQWLLQAIQLRGANLAPALTALIDSSRGERIGSFRPRVEQVTRDALLSVRRFLRLDGPHVTLDPPTISSHLGVNINTNQLIHLFADEAVVAIVSNAFGSVVEHSGKPLARVVKRAKLESTTHLLCKLLATEFPNFSEASPCSFHSWLQCTLARMCLGTHEKSVAEHPDLAKHRSNSSTIVVPATNLFTFLVQLLLPHVESLYMVTASALALLESNPSGGKSFYAKAATNATHKAALAALDDHLIVSPISCNKETIQHYYSSLLNAALICVDTSSSSSAGGNKGSGPVYAPGPRNNNDGVRSLLQQLHKLRPHAKLSMTETYTKVKMSVLQAYAEETQKSKM